MITIKDIARLAKVSQSTVSKALNGRPDVSNATREKILKIVEKQQYSRNAFGKALKNKYTENIGVIFRREKQPLSGNPFYSRVLEGIEAETALNDFNLVLQLAPEHQQPGLPKMVREGQVDGLVLVGVQEERYVENLLRSNIPIVLVDPKMKVQGCSQVLIDNENGAFLATQHLIQAGHRRIGFISGDLSRSSFRQRLDGYVKALKYHNIPFDEAMVKSQDVEAGYELAKSLLQSPNRPTAIFAANDINAIYAYKAISELGLRIPDDMSVVGFDDIDLARMASPPLTTVRVYKEELGSVAVRSLRKIIYEGRKKPETTIVPIRLIERDSVKKIKGTHLTVS